MAETFGAVASAIGVLGVAAQCVDGVRKLREFQKDVKTAKNDVGYMADELELLTLTIASIEAQVKASSQIATSVNAASALGFCQRSVRETATILRDIGSEIDKRKTGSIRAAWQKKSVEAYMTRIERAKSSLTMAYSVFTRELQKQEFVAVDTRLLQQQGFVSISFAQRQAATDDKVDQLQEFVDRRFDQIQNSIISTSVVNASQRQLERHNTCSSSTFGGVPNDGRSIIDVHSSRPPWPNHKKKQNPVLIARFRFRLPYWLLSRSLDFEIHRSSRSWTLNLSPRRVVSEDCELFECFAYYPAPSIRNVERMIVERRASLYDVDEYGRNILHHSFRWPGRQLNHFQLKLLDWAIDHGAEVTAADDDGVTPLGMMFLSCDGNEKRLAAIIHRTLQDCDQDRDLSLNRFRLALQRQLSILQSHLIWEEVSLNDRLDMLVTADICLYCPETLDAWIGRDNWERLWSECPPELCNKLLELLSGELGFELLDGLDEYDDSWNDIFSHLLKHLSSTQWNGSPRRSTPRFTMLIGFLQSFVTYRVYQSFGSLSETCQLAIETCQLAIETFANYFAIHDMDLSALGRHEQMAIARDETGQLDTWQCLHLDEVNRKIWRINVRIISMQYGARPEDWTIEVSNPTADAVAEVFGEFWCTVERVGFIDGEGEEFGDVRDAVEQLTRRVPGMWNADEDEEDQEEKSEEDSKDRFWGMDTISPERLLQLEYIIRQEEKQERRARFDKSKLEGRNLVF